MSNKNLFAYTGKEITIKKENLTVSVGGVELFPDQYEILENTYRNNQNKGTATVQIKGIGDYGGIATVKFKIGAKGFRWFYRKNPVIAMPKNSVVFRGQFGYNRVNLKCAIKSCYFEPTDTLNGIPTLSYRCQASSLLGT